MRQVRPNTYHTSRRRAIRQGDKLGSDLVLRTPAGRSAHDPAYGPIVHPRRSADFGQAVP